MLENTIVGVIVIGIVVLFIIASRKDKERVAKRKQTLQDLAIRWNLVFEPRAWPDLHEWLTHFHRFRPSRSPDFTHIIHGDAEGFRLYLMEFEVTRVTDKRSNPISALCVAGLNVELPPFRVIPRQYRDEGWMTMKWKKVDISGFEDLARIAVVLALDPEGFHRAIPADALHHIATERDLYVECANSALLISPPFGLWEPDDMLAMKTYGLELARRLNH